MTSEPLTLSKGKKRENEPKKLHEAEYSSSKRNPPSQTYTWDPRPENMRTVSDKYIKDFVFSMKWDSKPSMLESLFPYCYEDLKLQTIDIEIYRQLILTFF